MGSDKTHHPRSTRVHLAVPVFVYGRTPSDAPFKEIARTIEVNANGCLLEIETPVVKEQSLLLTNMRTQKEISCNVVSVGNPLNGKIRVGIRFSEASPRFWGLAFPPEDWDPADRKRPVRPGR